MRLLLNPVVGALFISTLLFSAGNSEAASPTPAGSPVPQSESSSQFLTASGMPPFDRRWRGPDYLRAAQVPRSGKVPLPKLSSPEGRAFFERLTSTENLTIFSNNAGALNARYLHCVDMNLGISEIALKCTRQPDCQAECARLGAFQLHLTGVFANLILEISAKKIQDWLGPSHGSSPSPHEVEKKNAGDKANSGFPGDGPLVPGNPTIVVTAQYPGASRPVMKVAVVAPILMKVFKELHYWMKFRSTVEPGIATLSIQFQPDIDKDTAISSVNEILREAVSADLPTDMREPPTITSATEFAD